MTIKLKSVFTMKIEFVINEDKNEIMVKTHSITDFEAIKAFKYSLKIYKKMYKYPELFLIIDDIKVDLYDMFTWV